MMIYRMHTCTQIETIKNCFNQKKHLTIVANDDEKYSLRYLFFSHRLGEREKKKTNRNQNRKNDWVQIFAISFVVNSRVLSVQCSWREHSSSSKNTQFSDTKRVQSSIALTITITRDRITQYICYQMRLEIPATIHQKNRSVSVYFLVFATFVGVIFVYFSACIIHASYITTWYGWDSPSAERFEETRTSAKR